MSLLYKPSGKIRTPVKYFLLFVSWLALDVFS